MIHLIHNTYLAPDKALDAYSRHPSIVVSQDYSKFPFPVDMRVFLKQVNPTYESLLAEHYEGDDSKLFTALASAKQRTILYADREAFQVLFLKHLRALFPHASADAVYSFYQMALLQCKIIHSQKQPISDNVAKAYRELPILSTSDFAEEWNDTIPPQSYPEAARLTAPFELKVATYLHHTFKGITLSDAFRKQFEISVTSVVRETVLWEIEDLKTNMLASAMDLAQVFPEEEDVENVEGFALIPSSLKFLLDPHCNPQNPGCLDRYDISYFYRVWKQWATYFHEYDERSYLVSLFTLMMQGATVKEYIEFDCNWMCGSQLFARSLYSDRVNPLFMSYVYHKYRTGQIHELEPLCLVGG